MHKYIPTYFTNIIEINPRVWKATNFKNNTSVIIKHCPFDEMSTALAFSKLKICPPVHALIFPKDLEFNRKISSGFCVQKAMIGDLDHFCERYQDPRFIDEVIAQINNISTIANMNGYKLHDNKLANYVYDNNKKIYRIDFYDCDGINNAFTRCTAAREIRQNLEKKFGII